MNDFYQRLMVSVKEPTQRKLGGAMQYCLGFNFCYENPDFRSGFLLVLIC